MRHMVAMGVVAAVLLNVVAAFLGRGSFLHGILVFALLIYVGAPALVIAAGAYCLRHRYGFARRLAAFGALVMLVSASSVASLAAGGVLADRDIAAAKEYCQ